MSEFTNMLKTNQAYVMSTFTFLIGIVANFLASTIKKRIQIIGVIIIAVVYDWFTWFLYEDCAVTLWAIAFTLIWIIICLSMIWKKEIVSRKKIDKMIRRFTSNAHQDKPLCIFGGDLNFFGDVVKNPSFWSRVTKDNSVIQFNKQYNQIVKKGFRKVQILSVKPDGDSEEDKKTRIRIGYLKAKLKRNLEIKFFIEKECMNCSERSTCLVCNVCEGCTEEKNCRRSRTQDCDKLMEASRGRCYNPDLQLRGRIAKRKSDGSTCAAIVTTHKSGKSYILKEYSSNTKECTIYENIWNVWWKKSMVDEKFLKNCINEYEGYTK